MSIEASPPATETSKSSASASTGGHAAKGKGKGGADTGFMAILGSMDDGSATTAVTAVTAAASASAGAVLATSKDAKTGPASTAMDAAAMLAQNPQIPQWLPVAKPDADSAALTAATNPTVALAGKGKSAPALAGAQPGAQPGGLAVADASESVAGSVQTTAAHARATQMAAAADASANANTASASNTAVTSAASDAKDSKDAKLAVATEFMKTVQAAPMAEQALVSAFAKTEKSTSERISAASKSADATYAAPSVGVSNSSFSDTSAATGGVAPAPEVQVAEQVKYWMSHDVQNAELKLDGLGKDPVQVSISMTGNEAHIAFRTNESQTRGILEGAAAHLKDMLGREGVTLAGVSVGTSGSNNSDTGGERRPRQGARQAFVTPAIGAVGNASTRVATGTGRALDLFV